MISLPHSPHAAADTPGSLWSCVGCLGAREAPWGGAVYDWISSSSPQSGGDSRVPPVLPWSVWG